MEPSDRGAVVAGSLAGLTLATMHFALQGVLERQPRPLAYVLGVGTLLAAYTGWAGAAGAGRYVRGLWIITALAGIGDLAAYAVRIDKNQHINRRVEANLDKAKRERPPQRS